MCLAPWYSRVWRSSQRRKWQTGERSRPVLLLCGSRGLWLVHDDPQTSHWCPLYYNIHTHTHTCSNRNEPLCRCETDTNSSTLTHSPAVSARGVDGPVLAAHHKVIDITQRKWHGGDGHWLGLFEHELQTVLHTHTLRRVSLTGWMRGDHSVSKWLFCWHFLGIFIYCIVLHILYIVKCNLFLWSKLNFQHHYPSLQCHIIFQKSF